MSQSTWQRLQIPLLRGVVRSETKNRLWIGRCNVIRSRIWHPEDESEAVQLSIRASAELDDTRRWNTRSLSAPAAPPSPVSIVIFCLTPPSVLQSYIFLVPCNRCLCTHSTSHSLLIEELRIPLKTAQLPRHITFTMAPSNPATGGHDQYLNYAEDRNAKSQGMRGEDPFGETWSDT